MLLKIIIVVVLVGANAFFVAAEFALVKLRSRDVKTLVRNGNAAAKRVDMITSHLDSYLSSCQLGITLASLGLGWVGEPIVARLMEPLFIFFGISVDMVHFAAVPIAFVLITFLHITLGEQVPKMLAIKRFQATSLAVSLPLVYFTRIFKPFIWVLNSSSNQILRLFGIRAGGGHGEVPTEEELRELMLDSATVGALTRRERILLENVLDLDDKIARRFMVPRNRVFYINKNTSIEDQLNLVAKSAHSRFPLCDGDLDNIIGMIHTKDIFKAVTLDEQLTSLTEIARQPTYLPETISLDVLLRGFQENHALMSILVDEYGNTSGIITLEDVVEELVGPILDEFDVEPPLIVKIGPGKYEVDAVTPIEDVIKTCQIADVDTQSDTIGGLMIEMLGHIPAVNEKVDLEGHKITVLVAEPTRIRRVLIEKVLQEGQEVQKAS